MTDFDDHLWSYLQSEHGADRVSAQRSGGVETGRGTLIARSGAVVAAAAVVAGALALSATSATPPAFAVTRHHNGSVTVRINRRSGIAGANRKLAVMGIHARVAGSPSFPVDWSCSIIPGSTVDLSAMLADAAQDAAEGNAAAAKDLRTGEAAIADGTEPDVVYNCTGSDQGNAASTNAG